MAKTDRSIYVIGHKNPDTDSIAAAIAYANLKCITTNKNYTAMRCGNVSSETQYVLDRFGFKPPKFIGDVRTQVRDMDMRNIPGVTDEISLKDAWKIMKDNKVVTLCITDGKYLKGLIKITKNSTAYRVLDVNWDDKLDSTDLDIMLKKSPTTPIPLISIIRAYTLRTGDFNYDGVVDSKDLANLNNNLDSKRIPSPSYMKINGRIVNTTSYISPLLRNDLHDLNHDGFVNSKDVDLMESYISYPIIYRLY